MVKVIHTDKRIRVRSTHKRLKKRIDAVRDVDLVVRGGVAGLAPTRFGVVVIKVHFTTQHIEAVDFMKDVQAGN